MAKQIFSEINVKAAAITGTILGFLCWLLALPFWFYGYGMISAYSTRISHVTTGMAYGLGIISLVSSIIIGAVAGILIAVIYNWALKLK